MGTLSAVRRQPVAVLLEVAWRWAFGIPALWLLYRSGTQVLSAVPWQATGITALSVNTLLTDPAKASETIAAFAIMVAPGVVAAARWLVPLLLLLWAVVSALGRTLVLRRMDAQLHAKPMTMIALQVLRLAPLVIAAAAWIAGLRWLGRVSIFDPITRGGEPQMMLYVGGAIALTLGLFVLSAAVSWIFSLAPLVAMMENRGAFLSVRAATNTGRLRGQFVEINLVLGIVKIALLVLATVFSACPLPFQSVMTDEFLFWWNVGVAVWYFLASDFFHVARLAGYLHIWQTSRD